MTQVQYAPTSLELRASVVGEGHRKTQAQREVLARESHALIVEYELQGGRHALRWLERHAGLSHSTASGYRDAGYALSRGLPSGVGVSALATMARYLRAGQTPQEALATWQDAEKRKAAAAQAGIGIGKVSYPTSLTGEIANTYADLVTSLSDAGLPQQGMPEMTATLLRVARFNMHPALLQHVEAGGGETWVAGTQVSPGNKNLSFYSWLSRQECACCGDAGVEIHHVRSFDIRDQPGGRRFKHAQGKELVMPLCLRHHATAREAAHQGGQDDWSTRHFGRPDAVYVLAARYLSEWAAESGVLRGEK